MSKPAPAEKSAPNTSSGSAQNQSQGSSATGSTRSALAQMKGYDVQRKALRPTNSNAAVQRKERGPGAASSDVQSAAQAGIKGSGGTLPYASAIQASFGRHDISSIRSHAGTEASAAAADIGARAYATGRDVVFGGSANLHTAAHEAAHVVQQRAGVSLKGGVGAAGDRYEQHADAVADRVVQGKSAEALLDTVATGALATNHSDAVQRKEVEHRRDLRGAQDWLHADRQRFGGTFQTANLHNLPRNAVREYTLIEQRRDFYTWFYNYTAARGYQTRWALAASLVANGAHQVAHMDGAAGAASQMLGVVNDELQGMMRIGNQVIFDNVFPKLNQLLLGGPLTGAAAMQWDMQVLSEEQTLIQPLYQGVSASTVQKLERIAKMQGLAWAGAKITGGDKVQPGPHSKGGNVPAFPSGDNITSIDDRWNYGMVLGDQFTPGGTGYNTRTHRRPAAGSNYSNGSELNRVDTRHNLHMIEGMLDNPRDADTRRLATLISSLTPAEQREFVADRSQDGYAYSDRVLSASFSTPTGSNMLLEHKHLVQTVQRSVARFPGGRAWLARYNAGVARQRRSAKALWRYLPTRGHMY